MNPVNTSILFLLRSVLTLSSRLRLLSGLAYSGFPIKTLYAFLIYHMRARCSVNLILCDLIILTFGDEYRL
jgi:hypothetical protein